MNFIKTFTGFFLFILVVFSSCKSDTQKDKLVSDSLTLEFTPVVLIETLSDAIPETSGLAEFDGLYWTINDSGGKNALYGFDKKTGKIKREIEVGNATNRDWETLTTDADFFYIGDVGNNSGSRKDLTIYKVNKSEMGAGSEYAKAEKITFRWSDQKYFVKANNSNPYDCEALLSFEDSLVLFAKDWVTKNTRMYMLPKAPGNYVARLDSEFESNGLITGADISPDKKVVVLSGYHNYNPFLWLFRDFEGNKFFESEKLRVEYPEFYSAQTEGVLFSGNDSILVSAERTTSWPQRVYYFSLKRIMAKAELEK